MFKARLLILTELQMNVMFRQMDTVQHHGPGLCIASRGKNMIIKPLFVSPVYFGAIPKSGLIGRVAAGRMSCLKLGGHTFSVPFM